MTEESHRIKTMIGQFTATASKNTILPALLSLCPSYWKLLLL
jgi:hypothetical protein